MPSQEFSALLRVAVEHYLNVVVAGGPGVIEIFAGLLLIGRSELVTEPVQGLPQRRAPMLTPTRFHA